MNDEHPKPKKAKDIESCVLNANTGSDDHEIVASVVVQIGKLDYKRSLESLECAESAGGEESQGMIEENESERASLSLG